MCVYLRLIVRAIKKARGRKPFFRRRALRVSRHGGSSTRQSGFFGSGGRGQTIPNMIIRTVPENGSEVNRFLIPLGNIFLPRRPQRTREDAEEVPKRGNTPQCEHKYMGGTGLERPADSSKKTQKLDGRAAKSAAISTPIDPQLQALIDAWPRLPEALKAAILAIVNSRQVHDRNHAGA